MYVYYGIVQWMEWAEFADGVHFYAIPVSTCTKLFLHAGEGGGAIIKHFRVCINYAERYIEFLKI